LTSFALKLEEAATPCRYDSFVTLQILFAASIASKMRASAAKTLWLARKRRYIDELGPTILTALERIKPG
jgi:hypothetical protein